MNNFRFQRSSKRKFTVRLDLTDTRTVITVLDVIGKLVVDLKENPNVIRLESMAFEVLEPTSTSPQTDPARINVLGRPALIMASDNAGPDGFYKIPEDSILRK